MSSNEVPPEKTPAGVQPELTSTPTTPSDNQQPENQQPENTVSPQSKKKQTQSSAAPGEVKVKRTPACAECRKKKLRCPHRQVIGEDGDAASSSQVTGTVVATGNEITTAPSEPGPSAETQAVKEEAGAQEEGPSKLPRRSERKPAIKKDLNESHPVQNGAGASSSAQAKQENPISRKGKRKAVETEGSTTNGATAIKPARPNRRPRLQANQSNHVNGSSSVMSAELVNLQQDPGHLNTAGIITWGSYNSNKIRRNMDRLWAEWDETMESFKIAEDDFNLSKIDAEIAENNFKLARESAEIAEKKFKQASESAEIAQGRCTEAMRLASRLRYTLEAWSRLYEQKQQEELQEGQETERKKREKQAKQ